MRLEGLYRKDVPEIAIEALRETIINAFCHRDYRDPDYVPVAIYKDRVEIRNPGGLFGGITIADLRKGHVSKRRNPLIADLFRRIEMVEAWGRGMPLILKHEPDVKFREMAEIFIAAFDRPSYKSEFEQEHSPAEKKKTAGEAVGKTWGEKVGEPEGEGSPKSSPKNTGRATQERSVKSLEEWGKQWGEKWGEKWGVAMATKRLKIVLAMLRNPRITTPELADMLDMGTTGVEKHLRLLRDCGCIKHVGPAKGGHWEVLK